MALAQAVTEPFVEEAVDSPTDEQRIIRPLGGDGVKNEDRMAAGMGDHHFGLARIVIDPNSQVGFSEDRAVSLAELVGQDQFAGVAAALDDMQMQIHSTGCLRYALGVDGRHGRQQPADINVVAFVQIHQGGECPRRIMHQRPAMGRAEQDQWLHPSGMRSDSSRQSCAPATRTLP